jgi:septum formation protein
MVHGRRFKFMNEKNILYLASQSLSRKRLLEQAEINFEVIGHDSCELKGTEVGCIHDYVRKIAEDKMDHVNIPKKMENENNSITILTADSLGYIREEGVILEKPKNIADAKKMIASYRDKEVEIITACCLSKQKFSNKIWFEVEQKIFNISGNIIFSIPDEEIDFYLSKNPEAMLACGAATIDGVGIRYLKHIEGSLSAILGLPIFELKKELQGFGF